VAGLTAAGGESDFHVRYVIRDSADELRRAVRDCDATVGLTGDTLYRNAGIFRAVVVQTVVAPRHPGSWSRPA
jgi:ABC-2 type transport system permease protein